MGANNSTMFFLNKNREGILGIGKKKKKKRKKKQHRHLLPM